ncbi:hypothetical protein Hte_008834 [Hypoxylon texense]
MSSTRRPARLRNACLHCTSAKVKCSGQRTGCDRCSKSGSECIYLESMAGRVPKKHKQPSGSFSSDAQHSTQPLDQIAGHDYNETLFTPLTIGEDSSLNTPDDDITLRLMPGHLMTGFSTNEVSSGETTNLFDIPFATFDHSFSTTRNGISIPSPHGFPTGEPASSLDQPTTLTGTDDNRGYSTARNDALSGSFSSSSHTNDGLSVSFTTPPRKESLDERCVLAATQIINALENCIARSHQLDVVLKTVRKAGVGLNGLIDLHRNLERKGRCIILFTMILYQNLDLLETVMGCLGLVNTDGGVRSHSVSSPSSREDMTEGQLEHLDAININIASLISSIGCREDIHVKSIWTRRVLEELAFGLETVARIARLMQASSATSYRDSLEEAPDNGGYVEQLKIKFEKLQLLAQRRI